MDLLETDFQNEIRAIAPELMFAEDDILIEIEDVGESLTPSLSMSPVSVDNPPSPVQYQSLTPVDKEALLDFVFSDHAYSKPYDSPRDTKNSDILHSPTRVLELFTSESMDSHQQNQQSDGEDDIDVIGVDESPEKLVTYDVSRAQSTMDDVEIYLNSLWNDVDKDDEEKFTRGSWSRDQARLFDAVYKIINNYQLSKLAYKQNSNEPVMRKLALDKATKRMRKVFGIALWNCKLIVWLHGVMLDGLGSSLFLCYLEILQSLKRMVPSLIERTLLYDRVANEKEITAGLPNLLSNLKKTWDPSIALQTKVSCDPLKITPYLIIIPSGPNIPHQSTKRNRVWNNQLVRFGKTVTISVPAYRTPEGYVIKHYLEHCISATRTRIKEFQSRCPSRPRVLIGWGIGSLISFKVGLLAKVNAIVCLGFPCSGLGEQLNEEYWEEYSHIETPVLFVVGTHALTNCQARIEKLREKIKAKTSLILVENADEMLRLPKSQKHMLGMTQSMIDKLIQDEVFLFLKDILFHVKTPPIPPSRNLSPKKKKIKIEEELLKKRKKKSPQLSASKPTNLPPLGVDVPLVTKEETFSQGLLTTKATSSPSLLNPDSSRGSVSGTSYRLQPNESRIGQKRPATTDKNPKKAKAVKKTFGNKVWGNFMPGHKFTANLGVKRAGNLLNKKFSPITDSPYSPSSIAATNVTLADSKYHPYLQQLSNTNAMGKTPHLSTTNTMFTALLPNSTASSPNITSYASSFNLQQKDPFVSNADISGRLDAQKDQEADYAASLLQDIGKQEKNDTSTSGTIVASSFPSSSTLLSTFETIMSNPSSDVIKQMPHADIRYLAALLSKQCNSQPASPTTSQTQVKNFSQQANFSKPVESQLKEESMAAETLSLERKLALLQNKKASHSLSHTQKVAVLKGNESLAHRTKVSRTGTVTSKSLSSRSSSSSPTETQFDSPRSAAATFNTLKQPQHSVNLTSYLAKQRIFFTSSISSTLTTNSQNLTTFPKRESPVGSNPGSPSAYLVNKLINMGASSLTQIDDNAIGSQSISNEMIDRSVSRGGSPYITSEGNPGTSTSFPDANDELITPRTRAGMFSPKNLVDNSNASMFASFFGKSPSVENLLSENTTDIDFNISSGKQVEENNRKYSMENTSKQILEATKLLSSSKRQSDANLGIETASKPEVQNLNQRRSFSSTSNTLAAGYSKGRPNDDSKIKTIFVARPSFIRGGVTSPGIRPALISASLKLKTSVGNSQNKAGKGIDNLNLFSTGGSTQRSSIADKIAAIIPLRKISDSSRYVKSSKQLNIKHISMDGTKGNSAITQVTGSPDKNSKRKQEDSRSMPSPQKDYPKKGRVLRPRIDLDRKASPKKRARNVSETSSDEDLIKISKPASITFVPQEKAKTIHDFLEVADKAANLNIELTETAQKPQTKSSKEAQLDTKLALPSSSNLTREVMVSVDDISKSENILSQHSESSVSTHELLVDATEFSGEGDGNPKSDDVTAKL